MANNCYVTKLKSIVDNDNLEKFNRFRIKVDLVTSSPYIGFRYTSDAMPFDAIMIGGTVTEGNYYAVQNCKTANITLAPNVDNYLEISKYPLTTLVTGYNQVVVDFSKLELNQHLTKIEIPVLVDVLPFSFVNLLNNNSNLHTFDVIGKTSQDITTETVDLSKTLIKTIKCKGLHSTWTTTSNVVMEEIQRIDFGDSLDAFLINQANIVGSTALKNWNITGTLTGSTAEIDAINTLKSHLVTFAINGQNMKA